MIDDQLALLAARIANERPPAIQIRLWLQELLYSRPLPQPETRLVIAIGESIPLDDSTVAALVRQIHDDREAHDEEIDAIHQAAAHCKDKCDCCRQIREMTLPVAMA